MIKWIIIGVLVTMAIMAIPNAIQEVREADEAGLKELEDLLKLNAKLEMELLDDLKVARADQTEGESDDQHRSDMDQGNPRQHQAIKANSRQT